MKNELDRFYDVPTNFREVHCGRIAGGVLYRSSHPVADGEADKAVILRASAAGIKTIINLCDRESEIKKLCVVAPWYNSIYRKGRVIALDMEFGFGNEEFNKKFLRGLRFMLAHEPPYLIHCYAGVDRTGFTCAVLEAFMGASIPDITKDYSRSFSVGAESALVLDFDDLKSVERIILEQLALMNGGNSIDSKNITGAARRYLLEDVGLSESELERLQKVLGNE